MLLENLTGLICHAWHLIMCLLASEILDSTLGLWLLYILLAERDRKVKKKTLLLEASYLFFIKSLAWLNMFRQLWHFKRNILLAQICAGFQTHQASCKIEATTHQIWWFIISSTHVLKTESISKPFLDVSLHYFGIFYYPHHWSFWKRLLIW